MAPGGLIWLKPKPIPPPFVWLLWKVVGTGTMVNARPTSVALTCSKTPTNATMRITMIDFCSNHRCQQQDRD